MAISSAKQSRGAAVALSASHSALGGNDPKCSRPTTVTATIGVTSPLVKEWGETYHRQKSCPRAHTATAGHNSGAYSLCRTLRRPEASTNITTEWVCPDCDYFEDVEEESE